MDEPHSFRPAVLKAATPFPDPAQADIRGLIAIGGDLKPERLLAAYRQGIFPWSVDPISWWSPDPRGIIELDEFHVSESLARVIRRKTFEVTMDRSFHGVMQACATPGPQREETWISMPFIEAYTLSMKWVTLIVWNAVRMANWSAVFTAFRSADYSPENPCFIVWPMLPKWRCFIWWNISVSATSGCSTSRR
jgi:hypothetical protein